jgi:hypothetical protein
VGVVRGGAALPQPLDPPPHPSPTRGEGVAWARLRLNLTPMGATLVVAPFAYCARTKGATTRVAPTAGSSFQIG